MNAKSLLLILFLYVCLVWVGAALLFSGHRVQEVGLTWTAIGLIVALVLVIGARLLGWWRLRTARKSAVRPATPPKPKQVVPEDDDDALAALIAEANATLAKVPAYAGKPGRTILSSLPLYLLIGPEGTGKTSAFVNSGLEPQLLAGQVAGTAPLVSTRLANLWLAKNAIFVEISGRIFGGDLVRWTQVLRVLQGKAPVPLWRRLWGEAEPGWALRAVIAFCDVKELMTPPADTQRSERYSRDWQERLRAVGDVFGVEFPVFVLFTKSDAIPYFPEYFRRLPESEANQILGCTLSLRRMDAGRRAESPVQAEVKRLTASFRPLYHSLAERRLSHLAHEPDPAKRPTVYEFPREFERIRPVLMQFLADSFRPQTLHPGPLLRGYYFTGVREVEVAALDAGTSRVDWSPPNVAMDGTQLFRGDATQFSRVEARPSVGRGRLTLRWMFIADLFHKVILADAPAQKVSPADPRLALYRRLALGAVCSLCALLCFAFFWSWAQNRSMLQAVASAGVPSLEKTGKQVTVDQLRSLEALRLQVEKLSRYDRKGAPWSLRWGLYSGGRVLAPARDAYFKSLQQLLLNDLNGALVARLAGLPSTPDASNSYQSVHDALKTQLIISSGECKPEPVLVARVLKAELAEAAQDVGSEWQALADAQIDFYASELAHGRPVHLVEDNAARDRARQYLQQIHGVEGIYAGILANAEKALGQPVRLSDLASNYAHVLNGSGEVSGVFTPAGWAYVEKASRGGNTGALGEPCVMGSATGIVGELKQDEATARAIQRLYIHDYVDHWRKFVEGFSVVRYTGSGDAARKLEILASHNSPLLALLALTSKETNFPKEPSASGAIQAKLESVPIVGKIAQAIKGTEKAAGSATETQPNAPDLLSSPADITQVFQPVQRVVPPGSETWVSDKNSAYIDALEQLRHSMQEIERGGSNPDPAVHQAAGQNYDKALDAVRQMARDFRPVGDQGLDVTVQHLLEQPIRLANAYIIRDMEAQGKGKVNGELRALCARLRNTLRKYPFQSKSPEDTSLDELASWFNPARGEIWKFQAQSLGDLTVKDGSQWKAKDPSKKPQVTQQVLAFLNRAQAVADAFYPGGVAQPRLTYVLRPKLDSSFGNSILELEIDGREYPWTTSLQKQFTWPAPPDAKTLGATARIKTGTLTFGIASRSGIWGIFRIMGDAEPRALSSKVVEWKYTRGTGGELVPIQPAPVRLEIVEFPGGVDVFNPRFFDGLQCPTQAVQ